MTFLLNDNKSEKNPVYKTRVDIQNNNNFINFIFYAENSNFFCPYKGEYNAPHWKGDACEIYIGNKKYYYEIVVAPDGGCMIALIKQKSKQHFKILKKIDENFIKVQANRTKNDYELCISIPNSKLITFGDLYFNCYRIETDGGECDKYLFSLNRTTNPLNFHESNSFIKLYFDL